MILLDTCSFLWLARGTLPQGVAARIRDQDNALFISAISAFEIGVKSAKGRLLLPMPLSVWWATLVDHHALGVVAVEAEIAIAATQLPPIHADPADRILVATAMHLGATLLTPDPMIAAYPDVRVEWNV